LPGKGTSITTIYVGEKAPPSAIPARPGINPPPSVDPWPDPGNLPQL
jgi:hypothetical protein